MNYNGRKSQKRSTSGVKRPIRNRKRMLFLQFSLIATLGVIAWRVGYVQHVYGPRLLSSAAEVQDRSHTILAPRGAILDSSGNRLAYDVPAYMMDLEVAAFSDKTQLANALTQPLGVNVNDVMQKLGSGAKWIRWPHPILEPEKEQIYSALKSMKKEQDVTFTPTEERFYPYGTFAANTLGYVDSMGVGGTGLEAEYNQDLSGQNGTVDYTQDAYGFPLPSTVHVTKKAEPGDDVETTIDSTVQGFVEHEMDNIINQYHPDHAAIIVMDPKTGAILGMSSRPTFNPNNYAQASPDALYTNWAVNSAFEPGSTFKTIVLAAALATHVISLDDTYNDPGYITVDGQRMYDWNYVGFGKTPTFRQALEDSSNVGFATIALKLGWSNLLTYMKDFGFMDKTGIDLPGERTSLLFPKSEQGKVQLATSGFGQGISVTPLQQMAAYAAIANGGTLMKPYLAKAIISPDGKVLKTINPTVVRSNFLPPDVVSEVNQTLVLDVSKGIDSSAIIKGYNVAGKTGTAQVVAPNGQYYSNRFIVSFMGYAPAENPKVEVYVTVDNPKTSVGNTWGSTIAAPPAKNIMKDCLDYYHIPPSGDASTLTDAKAAKSQQSTKYVETPSVVGETVAQATKTLAAAGITPVWIGGNGKVERQWPEQGIAVPVGSKLYAWVPGQSSGPIVMPDLTGMSMRDAGNLLTVLGIRFIPNGTGFVSRQSIKPGQPVAGGSTVTITCSPPPNTQ